MTSTKLSASSTSFYTPLHRVVNESVSVRVHHVKEKVDPDPNLELFQYRFLGSGTGTRTIYRTGLNPGMGLGRE